MDLRLGLDSMTMRTAGTGLFKMNAPHTQDGIRISQIIMEETKIV